MHQPKRPFKLQRKLDELLLTFTDTGQSIPVRLAWARPLSERGKGIVVLDEKKRELLMLESLDELDPASRQIAEEELAKRYIFPRITRVVSSRASFGVRYLHVETDLGERRLALSRTNKHAVRLSDEHIVLQDSLGCRYEINPLSALDPKSRAEVEKLI